MKANRASLQRVSLLLEISADLIESAQDAEAFISALETAGSVWRDIRTGELGGQLPARIYNFAVGVVTRARHGVRDEEVEALVRMHRAVARELMASPPPAPREVWREWMAARLPAFAG